MRSQISPVIVAGTHKFQRCHRLTGALRDFEGVYLFGDKQIDPSPFGSFLGSRGRRSATKSLAVLIEDLRLVSAVPELQPVNPRPPDSRGLYLCCHAPDSHTAM